MKGSLLFVLFWMGASGSLRADDRPDLPQDMASIARWLSEQTAEGIAFHAAASFDQPTELTLGEMGLDFNAGIGFLPLNHEEFPEMKVRILEDQNVQSFFGKEVTFPDLTAHYRVGMPLRSDLGLKFSNTTIPTRQITPSTRGRGQSNVIGAELRKHFLGIAHPLISLSATADYVQGHFDFFNEFRNLNISDLVFLNSSNRGRLDWDIQSYGLKATISGYLGQWMPFFGLGYNYNRGTVKSLLLADFKTDLLEDLQGTAVASPTPNIMRISAGSRYGLSFMNLTLNGEVLAVGKGAGKTFAVNLGMSFPLRLRAGSREYDQYQARKKTKEYFASPSFTSLTVLH